MSRLVCGFTDIEVQRLFKQYKIYNYLKRYLKKYNNIPDEFDVDEMNPYPDKIWVMWQQGYENAPDIVKMCINSIKKYANKEIIFLDDTNISQYVNLPDYIQDKYNSGKMKRALYSDIVRLYLLDRYGGTWIDATVYCTGNIDYITNSELFIFQKFETKQPMIISNWLLHSKKPNNILIKSMKKCLYSYWKENDDPIYYYMMHMFHKLLIDNNENCKNEWLKVPCYLYSLPFLLIREMCKKYDKQRIDYILSLTPVHKLSYKTGGRHLSTNIDENSYYNMIMNDYTKGLNLVS